MYMDVVKDIALDWTPDKEAFSVKCFEDDICRKLAESFEKVTKNCLSPNEENSSLSSANPTKNDEDLVKIIREFPIKIYFGSERFNSHRRLTPAQREIFYAEEELIRKIWISLNHTRVHLNSSGSPTFEEYVVEKYVAVPSNGINTLTEILVDLAEKCVQEFSPLQKEALLKGFELGMDYNRQELHRSTEKALIYNLAESIAYQFSSSNSYFHSFNEEFNKIVSEIVSRYGEIYLYIKNIYCGRMSMMNL